MFEAKKAIAWPAIVVFIAGVGAIVFVAAGPRKRVPSSRTYSNTATLLPIDKTERFPIPAEPHSTAPPQKPSQPGPVQNIRFTLYDAGIYPREVRVQTGTVAIAIEDRTGTSTGLLIEVPDEKQNTRGYQVESLNEHGRGRGQFQLEPGEYRVVDVSRPENTAVLVVKP